MHRLGILLGALAVLASAGPSWAVVPPNNIAYVDPIGGTDGTTCGAPDTPCKTLNGGLQNITIAGTVIIVSGGTFGPVILGNNNVDVTVEGPADKSAVIVWTATLPGCIGGIPGSCNGNQPATVAVQIGPSQPGTVRLRNLVIDNRAGTNGAIDILSMTNVSMINVTVRGGTGTIPQMIWMRPFSGTLSTLFMLNCDIGFSASGGGLLVTTSGAHVNSHIINTTVHNTSSASNSMALLEAARLR
jgi:hypothetical protein